MFLAGEIFIDDLTGLTAWDGAVHAVPFTARMLSTYVVPTMPALPPQLLANPALDDPAAWTADAAWGLDGDGATVTANGSTWQKIYPNPQPTMGAAADIVLAFRIEDQTSTHYTGGVRGALLSNSSTNNHYHGRPTASAALFAPNIAHTFNRTASQNTYYLESSPNWSGRVSVQGLYDVSAVRSLPTVVIPQLGQSNRECAGEGGADPALDVWHPNIWMCPPINYSFYGATQNIASVAQDPLIHNGSPMQRVGMAMSMARRLVALTNGAIRVVIVPCAKSGTTLVGPAAHWNPDTTGTGAENRLFERAVNTTLAAMGQITNHIGTILCWSQGEADWQNYAQYPAAFSNFLTRFKAATGIADLPVIVGGGVIADPASPSALVTMQRTLDKDSGHTNAMADVTYYDGPVGQQHINTGDTVHFTTAANRIRGDYEGQLAYLLGRDRGWWT